MANKSYDQRTDNKINLKNINSNCVFKRKNITREYVLAVRGENAKQSIGKIYNGCEIFGFTKGQFSAIDILVHCLEEIGPSNVFISTWSASDTDIKMAQKLIKTDKIKDIKLIVDFSFKSRKPQFCQAMIDAFGYDCIRVTVIHAKFFLIYNDNFNLVVRTSMNLNYNPRFEHFEISDNYEFRIFHQKIIDEIWNNQKAAVGFEGYNGMSETKYNLIQFKNAFEEQKKKIEEKKVSVSKHDSYNSLNYDSYELL